jgi:DUF1365 family protein
MHSSIYVGRVEHRRRVPVRHAFGYRLFMVYLDLAELDRVFAGRWLWSASRPALARFRRADHFGDPAVPLDRAVRNLVEERTGTRPQGPIRLLTHLAYFGYCFNPVSFYYCFDRSGEVLEAIVAEVANTPWGEQHCYVLETRDGAVGAVRRFLLAKRLHVSPFMAMDVEYDWSFSPPDECLLVRMRCNRGEPQLDALLLLERKPISGPLLARLLIGYPFMTVKVILAIYWQALKLWLKRCAVYEHPAKRSGGTTGLSGAD